jgi:hypothetical protein
MSKEVRAARAARSSLSLSDRKFHQLTGQLRDAYAKLDGTLIDTLLLSAAMIETAQEIGLEPEVGQKLFADFNDCVGTLMDGRQKMVAAHTRATAIRMRTTQAERSDGCWPLPGGGIQQEDTGVSHLRAA